MKSAPANSGTEPQSSGSKTLLLVDGSSYLYRAFHAMEQKDLRSRRGEPTGAIHVVLNMLRRLRREYNADYIACVFDAKGKTFREERYPQYKANRPAMPEDLAIQIEPLQQCIRALGWPLLIIEGVEADDVIGTLVTHAAREGINSIVSTGDKDLAQLVNRQVSLINTMNNEKLDEQGVLAKFGVEPSRILDYLTLIGDSVDNVPGVEMVGPKTAVKWLSQYQTLDNLMAHASEIPGVVGENLRKSLDWLPQARQLLTVKCDVTLPVSLDDLTPRSPDTEKLTMLFERFDLKKWLEEIRASRAKAQGSGLAADVSESIDFSIEPRALGTQPRTYETLLTADQLSAWLEKINSAALVSVDTETTGLDPLQSKLVGISFSVQAHHAAYLPLAHRYSAAPPQLDLQWALQKLKPWLEDAGKSKLGQNLKYDKHIFANHGVTLRGIEHDTLLQSYVLESHRPHDLDTLAQRHLGVKTVTYDEVTGKGPGRIGFEQVAVEQATDYAAEDADIALQLHQNLYPQIAGEPKLEAVYRQVEMPLIDVLFDMERYGVLLDVKRLEEQSRELGNRLVELENEIYRLAEQPFNINSPKQIQEILFERHKLPVVKKTPGGAPSTDEDVLQELALDYPLAKLILDYRGLAKLKSTYTDKLPRMVNAGTGRVHTNYAQAIAVTGRLASNDPNLQNIPVRTQEGRRIREAFIAAPGRQIVSADYSQIELRIMAHISRDASLLKAFAEGEDIHRATAAEIFGIAPNEVGAEQRRYAKVINFGLIYGMSAFGLASQLGIDRGAAQLYMERYFARYPKVADYMQRTRELAKQQGFVETVLGRRLWLPDINSSNNARRQGAERAAINAPMQGTAADLIKLAMIAVHEWLKHKNLKARLIMQVHDELVLEVPDDELGLLRIELPNLMCSVAKLEVPLVVHVGTGPNWEKAH
ncbi:MAG TPA: DNA polymerase I [Burkholderiales bacterium]|nr:DNA polymerase I [Burkholderiales bacterium]